MLFKATWTRANHQHEVAEHVEDLAEVAADAESYPTSAVWTIHLDPPTACILRPNKVRAEPREAALEKVSIITQVDLIVTYMGI